MKDLIKKQNEELRYKANSSSGLGGFDLGVFDDVAHQNLRSFISKVRKETAKKVCDKILMSDEDWCCLECLQEKQKEIKKHILEEL